MNTRKMVYLHHSQKINNKIKLNKLSQKPRNNPSDLVLNNTSTPVSQKQVKRVSQPKTK